MERESHIQVHPAALDDAVTEAKEFLKPALIPRKYNSYRTPTISYKFKSRRGGFA
jgi:hypothetical protein